MKSVTTKVETTSRLTELQLNGDLFPYLAKYLFCEEATNEKFEKIQRASCPREWQGNGNDSIFCIGPNHTISPLEELDKDSKFLWTTKRKKMKSLSP